MKRSHYLLVATGILLAVGGTYLFTKQSETAETKVKQPNRDSKVGGSNPQDSSSISAATSVMPGNPSKGSGIQPATTAAKPVISSGTPAVGAAPSALSPKEAFRAADYRPVTYAEGVPNYEGERVTAYISLPSGGATATGAASDVPQKLALTLNQMGEYPRVNIQAGEKVNINLAFTDSKEGTPVAMSAQDGGTVEGKKLSAAGLVDGQRQLAFDFQSGQNPGIYRVNLRTPNGEVKTLNFWVGPPSVLQAAR